MFYLLGLLSAIAPLAIDLYLPAFSAIADDLNAPLSSIQMTLAVFMLGFAFSQLFYGPLSDRFGRKPVIVSGLAFYALGSMVCAVAPDATTLIVARLIQALGCGAVVVVVPAVVSDRYRGVGAAKAMSSVMSIMVLAPLLAPSLGGQLLKMGDWHLIFYVQAVLAVVLLAAAMLFLVETHDKERRPFNVKSVLSSYLEVAKNPQALAYTLGGGFASGGLFVFIAASPFVYMTYFNVSVEVYGLLFSTNVCMMMLLTWLNGRIVTKFGMDVILRFASLNLLCAGVAMIVVAVCVDRLWPLVACVVWFVGTLGLVGANSVTAAVSCFPQMAGTVSALLNGTRFVLAAVGAAAVGWFAPESPLPMAVLMTLCGMVSFYVFYVRLARLSS